MAVQLILQRAGGGTINLYNKNAAALSTVTRAEQKQFLLGEDIVNITVESAVKIPFAIGDKTTIFGRDYKINRLPKPKKTGNRLFTYDIELEGVQYDLMRATYDLNIDTTNNELQDVQADTLTGNLHRFATVLIANANRVFPGKWTLGEYPADTEDKALTFGETDNCLSVLQQLCSEYNTEFDIEQAGGVNTINFGKAGQIFPYTFEYGKGKGLYELERQNVSSANIVTRLKVYGGTRNVSYKYRANRLCLPGKTKGQSFIEKPDAVARYGIWEATKYFDNIYPSRTGTITGLVSGSVLKFVDNTMNFDLNEKEADGVTTKYLLDGVAAKIHFNSGNLSGYEFELQSYDHATKTFTLKPFKDERDETFPSEKSEAFQFATGDKYVILDIALPQTYIDDAEVRLAAEGNTYYDQNSQPKVQYSLAVAEEFLKSLSGVGGTTNIFQVGDYLPVKDTDIDVDKSVRIQGFTRNLIDEYKYQLTISDTVTTNITNRVISELIDIDKVIKINNLKDPAKARRDWRSAQELLDMVFDTEGDYYSEKIKPNSIETSMLAVGAKSTQFGLVGTVIQANYNGNKNSVNVKGGTLSHYAIEESGRNWTLADGTTTLTGDSTPYYIYAKCQKVGTAGSIIFSTSKIKVDEDPSFYHFLIGVVNSVDPTLDVRSVALTYGFTTVNGKFIRTGRIQSNDGLTYFDLDLGEIGGKITFRSTGGTDEDLAEILDGVGSDIQDAQAAANAAALLAQQAIDDAEANVGLINTEVSKLQTQIDGEVSNWFYPYTPTLANYPASDWTTNEIKDRHIGDTFTNTAQAPATDAGKSWRFVKNGSTYSWTLIADSDAVKALLKAAEAQATADGKSTTHLFQPTKYKLGDMWVLNSDITLNGIAYKQGDILTATQDSTTFVEAHWVKKVRYTDDTAVNNLQIGSRNYLRNSIQEGGWGLNEFNSAIINYENGYVQFTTPSDGNYSKGVYRSISTTENLVGKNVVLSFDAYSNGGDPATVYINSNSERLIESLTTSWMRYYLPIKNFQNGSIVITNLYANRYYFFRNFKIVVGDKDVESFTEAPEDIQASIETALTAAGNAQTTADSLKNFTDISFRDGIIDRSESIAIEKYKNSLNETMSKAEASYNKVYTNTYLEGTAKTSLLNAKVNLWGQRDTLLSAINTAISGGTTTPAQKTAVDNAFSTFNSLMSAFQNALEEANKAIQNKLKSFSDEAKDAADAAGAIAADAQAKANTAKAITDKFKTTINGGLINTVMMLLRDLNSVIETAGISGIQGAMKNNPSYWSGGTYAQAFALIEFLSKMSAGTTPGANEYEGLAKITMLHNGAAKVGDFIIEESGRIVMIDPATGKPRLMFTIYNLPLIADLMSSVAFGDSANIGAGSTSTSQVLSGIMTIDKTGAIATFSGSTLNISAAGQRPNDGITPYSYATATLWLRRGSSRSEVIASVSVSFTEDDNLLKLNQYVIPQYSFPLGSPAAYTFELVVTSGGLVSSALATSSAFTFSWSFVQQGVRYQQYGLDGMMFFYSNHHFHFTEGGGLDGRALPGKWNAPGVLLSATVLSGGGWQDVWGAKTSATNPARNSAGKYTVYHNVGHTKYQVTASPLTGNRTYYIVSKSETNFVIQWYTVGSSPAASDTNFDFQITGNNYN